FMRRRAQAADAGSRRALPQFPKAFVVALLIAAVYAVWLVSAAAATIAAIAAIVVALQMAMRDLVFFFWKDDADPGVLPSIVLSAARFVVVLLGLGACALALETPITTLVENESPMLRLGLRALGVATLALLTNVVWIAVRTTIDQRLARIRPAVSHDGPDANARLLTLLPLLRVTAAVVLVVMLVLSSLWALGIEITPLLAGAGVVGLALGFGAQALVRDVIAGIFFLAEDAFRIGEYIESGTATKGTVERISLRTVALRHHNGPLHFVPYGALGTVRNTSRDWVIEKFNLPLPIGVDSEKIRKMIKKVGDDMQADPDIGPLVIEPLKGKLYRIDPGVKIFRCKFRTAPGKQFDVRAQAFKRIEAALKATGVSFADGMQTVVVQPAPAA
ncbi:MAG: mechanosensitive ion channel family protein, partial [Terriglobales bacterium]